MKNEKTPLPKFDHDVPRFSRWFHEKTGNIYIVLGQAYQESDLTPVVVYSQDNWSPIFTRPTEEFMDGRFKRI